MNNKECIINRFYKSKSGEICIGFKFKFGEISQEQEATLWALWNQGTPLSLPLPEIYQDPNQASL